MYFKNNVNVYMTPGVLCTYKKNANVDIAPGVWKAWLKSASFGYKAAASITIHQPEKNWKGKLSL